MLKMQNNISVINIFKLIKIKQWVKNLLILAPAIFAGALFDILNIDLILSFLAISFASSFSYIVNDIADLKNDILHKTKKFRPIANGDIKIKTAIVISIVCLFLSLIFYTPINYLIISYILLTLLYTFLLKNYAIIDTITISMGYIIRLFIGSKLFNIELSNWIIIMVFLLAMFLAFSKRYDDIKNQCSDVRLSYKGYSIEFISGILFILASAIIVAYILYCMSPSVIAQFNTKYLYITSIFVLLGILRYLQLIFVYNVSVSPTNIIYGDNFLKIDIFLWLVSFIWIIY